jgi:hypothetical protein
MHYRPRRSTLSRDQWQQQRERFQIEPEVPPPTDDQSAPLKDPVMRLMKSLGLNAETTQQRLMAGWAEMAGPQLCRHIRPGQLENGTLTIYATNSIVYTELRTWQGPQLLTNIQTGLGEGGAREVRRLRFAMDPDTRPNRR